MSADFKAIVLAMAEQRPDARVSTIVALAIAAEKAVRTPDLDDPKDLADWALLQPAVKAEVDAERKIHAIKELRAASGASLLQAKNAVDTFRFAR